MRNEDKANDEAPWSPPMVVVSRQGNSYRLRLGGSGTLLDRLVPVDGVYEVEAIIDHRPAEVGPEARHIEYLVKWTGFDRQDSTWEPGESLQQGAIDAISDYWSARSPATTANTPRSGRQRKQERRIDKLKAKLVPH